MKSCLLNRLHHAIERHQGRIVRNDRLGIAKADLGLFDAVEPFQGPFDHHGSGESRHPLDAENHLLERSTLCFSRGRLNPFPSTPFLGFASKSQYEDER